MKPIRAVTGITLIFCIITLAPQVFAAQEKYTETILQPSQSPRSFMFSSDGKPLQDSHFETLFIPGGPGIVLSGDEVVNAKASADFGVLRVFNRAASGGQGGTVGPVYLPTLSGSTARFVIDDFTVTSIGGGAAAVPVQLRFGMSASLAKPVAQGQVYSTEALLNQPNDQLGSALANLALFIHVRAPVGQVGGVNFGGTAQRFQSVTYGGSILPDDFFVSGAFVGREGHLRGHNGFVMETPVFGVPVGVPLELSVELRSLAAVGVTLPDEGGLWGADAIVDASQTLTFALDQVAILPPGYTLNSAQAGIVNNVWSPVPVPGVAWLVAGMLAWVGQRRRDLSAHRSPAATIAG